MIQKLKRKEFEVEALPWNGTNVIEANAFTGQNLYVEPNGQIWFTHTKDSSYGTHADKGDWIIKGINGHLSACRAVDLPFEYDLVDCPPDLLR